MIGTMEASKSALTVKFFFPMLFRAHGFNMVRKTAFADVLGAAGALAGCGNAAFTWALGLGRQRISWRSTEKMEILPKLISQKLKFYQNIFYRNYFLP